MKETAGLTEYKKTQGHFNTERVALHEICSVRNRFLSMQLAMNMK